MSLSKETESTHKTNKMPDILKLIKEELPSKITDATFEGANIVLYTDDKDFFKEGEEKIKEIVSKIKKRIELRADKKILAPESETEKTIRALVDQEAEITNIIFDVQRSVVVIEAKKPGVVIGKGGAVLYDIKKSTFWLPIVQRSPAIPSKITEKIRSVLYANNNYRRKFLNDVGKKIYNEWNPEKKDIWIRLTYLGGSSQVGRSCLLLHTPNSKILLDCGVNPAISDGPDKFPYLDVSEISDLNTIDAIILSHAHLDHCLPPHTLVLTKEGYKEIDQINSGDIIISLNWNTGKYEESKCTQKTRTFGHKKILTIKTPYSKIEASPNHRFFTFENLYLKEMEASELKEGMLLPSNLLHKPKIKKEDITLNIDVPYDERRKDNIILPSVLTSKLSEFIGYYMGDGHKSSEFSLRLTDNSVQILEHHKDLIKEIFNHEAKIRHHSDRTKNAHILEINNIKIIRFLEKNFPEVFLRTVNIKVPAKILNSHLEIQGAFIKGFADADGTVTNRIKITSHSEKMLEGLQYLLSLQNIPSHINKKDICISSKFSMKQFYGRIGFSLIYKQKKLEKILEAYSQTKFEKQDILPLSTNDLRTILKQAGMLGRIHKSPKASEFLSSGLLNLFRGNTRYATRESVNKLIEILNYRLVELDAIAKTNLYALRQLLSITREEISTETGLKVFQIQQIEENKTFSVAYMKFASIFSSFMKEKLAILTTQTQKNIQILRNLLSLDIIWEKITKIKEDNNQHPYLVDLQVENNHNFIAGNIIVHNCGLIPYLYKMGYRGPCYMTLPTRDIAALLQLDLIGVAYKKAQFPIYKADDIKEMVRHSICLDYGEVTDITSDIRITFYNAGHVLGSAQTHINIGNGLHNFVYTGDTKYGKTRLLDPAANRFPRVETMQLESTYGGKQDVLPSLREVEEKFIALVQETIAKKGKILLPELGLGHSQETMLRVEEAIRQGALPRIPVYIDGMIWDINAIHTAYPDFLSANVRNKIFQDNNPFLSDIFRRIGSPAERKEVLEGPSCIIIATSGMLNGGASVEYFRHLADNPNNLIVFGCYQAAGSLGRQIKEGAAEVNLGSDYNNETVKVKLRVETMYGLSAHSGRNELLQFISRMSPKPKKIIINHGEISKSLDLASTLYRSNQVETTVPKNLETTRLK